MNNYLRASTPLQKPHVPQVIIKDDELLETLTARMCHDYLTASGWTEHEKIGGYRPRDAVVYLPPRADKHSARNNPVLIPHKTFRSNSGKSFALGLIARAERRSALLTLWDIMDTAAGQSIRSAAVVSGETLEQTRRVLNMNLEGLDVCGACERLETCANCADCRSRDYTDCAEFRQSTEILRIIEELARMPAHLARRAAQAPAR